MAISNELSSEIASAILAAKDKSPDELRNLKEIVMMVHHTLQQLTTQSRPMLGHQKPLTKTPQISREYQD